MTAITPRRRGLALAAMVFAVAMTIIDQTIVSVAAPRIQTDLGLTGTGLQWVVNAYLLAMAALFAFGGRLADTVGNRRMVTVGIAVFATASALCGLTPSGGLAEPWLITFRAGQGVGAALMYPAALAVVVNSYEVERRGRALALFFGVAGGLTALGPALGGYLAAWSWRSIFWINVPIALVAYALLVRADLRDRRRPAPLDVRGLLLVTAGVGSSVFALQQSAGRGWTSPLTLGLLLAGAALLVGFVLVERRTAVPLMRLTIFDERSFRVDNVVLFAAMTVFVPVFFFTSEYGQIALGQTPSQASLMLLYFFAGFVVAAQLGGRMLDRIGARRPVVLGATVAAVGLHLWASHVATLSVGSQVAFIVVSGAGMGLLLGQANTDALNHAPRTEYGEATGITQTVRNFGASVGLAAMGTLLVTRLQTHLTTSLVGRGVPLDRAQAVAAGVAQHRDGAASVVPAFVRADFAAATGSVLTAMSWVMAATAVVALVGLPRRPRHTATLSRVQREVGQPVLVGGK